MKAVLQLNLRTSLAEEGQQMLFDLCEKLKRKGLVDEYHFEIMTADGPVTEKCLLSNQKVVA